MKISVITSPFGYIPPHGFGAVERMWSDIGFEMSKQGHDITFISKRKDNLDYKEFNFIGIKGYNRTGSIYFDLFYDLIYSIRALFKLKKTDILVLNTFWSPFFSVFFRKKFKYSVYNVQRIPKGQLFLYGNVDRFACVSHAVYNKVIQNSKKNEKKSLVIHNPINTEVFKYHEPRVKDGIFKILYFGRIHPEKGLEILVNSANLLVNEGYKIELNLLGPSKIENGGGGPNFVKKLNGISSEMKINWHLPVSDSTVLKEMLIQNDLFCYPSIAEKGETFGVAPLEAMGSGRATIVSSLECFEDFLIDNSNGLVFDHRHEVPEKQLRNKIKRLIDDPEFRNRLALNGAKSAKKFSNSIISTKYLEDFKGLLKSKINRE